MAHSFQPIPCPYSYDYVVSASGKVLKWDMMFGRWVDMNSRTVEAADTDDDTGAASGEVLPGDWTRTR